MAALVMLVVVTSVLVPITVQAAPFPQEYTYAECSRADKAAVQAEMTTLAHGVLVEGSSGLEIDALVASTWRTLGADATYDAAVDAGIARIEAETRVLGTLLVWLVGGQSAGICGASGDLCFCR